MEWGVRKCTLFLDMVRMDDVAGYVGISSGLP